MPDPVLFAKAMSAAGVACAALVAALLAWEKPAGGLRTSLAHVLGLALAMIVGCVVLRLTPHWPPLDGLDRLLLIVLPAAAVIEMIAAAPKVPRWAVWLLRITVAAVAGRVLLHGSGYLAGSITGWSIGQVYAALATGAFLFMTVWWSLGRLAERSPGVSMTLVLCAVSVAAGLALMLSGYASGGQAALPLAAGLAALALVPLVLKTAMPGRAALGIGILGLFGILILGVFFGELSVGRATVLFLSPLAAWVSELPILRARKPWIVAAARLALAGIPVAVVLFLAQRDFAKNMEGQPGGYEDDAY